MSKPQFGDYGEPWVGYVNSEGLWTIRHQFTKRCVSSGLTADDAQRILAAVNACAGLSDEQLMRVRAVNEMYQACKDAAWLYDQMALGPLEAAAKYGPDYEPPSDDDFLEIRGNLHGALALAEGKDGE